MQEHIRRAHPEHYISKLPATEESFHLMINTPPSERRLTEQGQGSANQGESSLCSSIPSLSADPFQGFRDRNAYSLTPHADERPNVSGLGAAGAAAVLAELHGVKSERASADLDGVSDGESIR